MFFKQRLRQVIRACKVSLLLFSCISFTGLFFLAISGCVARFQPSQPLTIFNAENDERVVWASERTNVPQYVPKEASGRYVQDTEGKLVGGIPLNAFRAIPIHQGEIHDLVVFSDGHGVITGGADGNVMMTSVLNLGSPRTLMELETKKILNSQRPVLSLAISRTNRYLAVAWFSYLVVYDFKENGVIAEFTRLNGRITSLVFDPREELLLLGLASGDVYGWDFGRKNDTLEDIESYLAATSPILRLAFHPAARSFFAMETNGNIALWRLLRTEQEIGLRDENSSLDLLRLGKTRQEFGNVAGVKFTDFDLSAKQGKVYVSCDDGKIRGWKIRGLVPESPIDASKDALTSLTFANIRGKGEPREVLVSTGREQRVKFWCGNGHFLAQSELLKDPISLVRSNENSRVLWGVQKTGNLVFVDLDSGDLWRILEEKLEQCGSSE